MGERLVNHTIANISVIDRDMCEYRCYLDHNCVSVNFYFGENGAEVHNCELNNSTGKKYDNDLVKAANHVYHRTKVPVDKCQLHYSLLEIRECCMGTLFIHVWKTPDYLFVFVEEFLRSSFIPEQRHLPVGVYKKTISMFMCVWIYRPRL